MRARVLVSITIGLLVVCGCARNSGEGSNATNGAGVTTRAAQSLSKALDAAAQSKKVVLVDFFTTWCEPCKRLERETWNDPTVRAWMNEHCVDLQIDADADVELARRHRVGGYPTILMLAPDGKELARIAGFRDPKAFLDELNATLNEETPLTRAEKALVGHEDDPRLRARYADRLAAADRYEEALKEYLWCYDEAVGQPGEMGMRSTSLLADIVSLGAKYPPAKRALEMRRDEAEQRVKDTVIPLKSSNLELTRRAAQDLLAVSALNDGLRTPERTIALYEDMRRRGELHFSQKTVFAQTLIGPFVQARRYQDALGLFDAPESYVTSRIQMAKMLIGAERSSSIESSTPSTDDMSTRIAVTDMSRVYEALVGTRQTERADKVADQILAFAPNWPTYVTLIEAAARAGSSDTARQIGTRGLGLLNAEGVAVVKDALGRLPM